MACVVVLCVDNVPCFMTVSYIYCFIVVKSSLKKGMTVLTSKFNILKYY